MIAFIIIFLLIGLSLYLAFVYTAHKDYKERKENPGHTPHTYNKTGEFSYKPNPHPLFSPKPRDDIFLSLVFPAYNEEKRLAPALERTIKFFSQKSFKYEIIIVNDGSKDRTFELIKQQMKLYRKSILSSKISRKASPTMSRITFPKISLKTILQIR